MKFKLAGQVGIACASSSVRGSGESKAAPKTVALQPLRPAFQYTGSFSEFLEEIPLEFFPTSAVMCRRALVAGKGPALSFGWCYYPKGF